MVKESSEKRRVYARDSGRKAKIEEEGINERGREGGPEEGGRGRRGS